MKTTNIYIDGTYYSKIWKYLKFDLLPIQMEINLAQFNNCLNKYVADYYNLGRDDLIVKKASVFLDESELGKRTDSFADTFKNAEINVFTQSSSVLVESRKDIDLVWQACKDYYKSPYDFLVLISDQEKFLPLIKELREEGVKIIFVVFGSLSKTKTDYLRNADLVVDLEKLISEDDDEDITAIFRKRILSEIESESAKDNEEIIVKDLQYLSFSNDSNLVEVSRKERLKSFDELKNVILKARKIGDQRKEELRKFCNNIGLQNIDYELVDIVFLHKSYANEISMVNKNLELSYIGHDLIDLIISVYLYRVFSNKGIAPHEMAVKQRTYKTEDNVSVAAKDIGMDKYLILGKGEDNTGGRDKPVILSAAFASLVGLLFLANGYETAEDFVIKHLLNKLDDKNLTKNNDYKTLLQEFTQKNYKVAPTYSVDRIEGPQHEQIFWMSIRIKNKKFGPVMGKNKKEASQNIAKVAYEYLKTHSL